MIKRLTSQQTRELAAPALSTSRRRRHELGLWQRRFWEHQIRDERDFGQHMDYIHWNPVKHGYVGAVADWPYSSFHKFVRDDTYPSRWGGNGEVPNRRVVTASRFDVRTAHATDYSPALVSFADEVEHAIQIILAHPDVGTPVGAVCGGFL